MDKYFKKNVSKRERNWKIIDSESDDSDVICENLNSSRGQLFPSKHVNSIYHTTDIRSYQSDKKTYFLKEFTFPLFRRAIDPNWNRTSHSWLTQYDFKQYKRRTSVINSSFQLQLTAPNGTTSLHVVNTRTSDMSFSTNDNLMIASNCIKGSYLSFIKGNTLYSNNEIITPSFNRHLSIPTQFYYHEVISSFQWLVPDETVLVTRNGCRTLSIFDINSIQSIDLVTFPSYIENVIPYSNSNSNSFIVSFNGGHVKLVDMRENHHFISKWSTVNTNRKYISCISQSNTNDNELSIVYKNPCSLDIYDIRNTTVSLITGKKAPALIKSNPLSLPTAAYPISLHPFLNDSTYIASISNGAVALINKYTGEILLYNDSLTTSPEYSKDAIISRPMKPCFVHSSFYVPSLCKETLSIPLFDFDSIQSTIESESPSVYYIPCEEKVYGCCYSEQLDMFVVACGGNTADHKLYLYSYK